MIVFILLDSFFCYSVGIESKSENNVFDCYCIRFLYFIYCETNAYLCLCCVRATHYSSVSVGPLYSRIEHKAKVKQQNNDDSQQQTINMREICITEAHAVGRSADAILYQSKLCFDFINS